MATKVFLLDTVASTHRGTNTANQQGSAVGWQPKMANTTTPPVGGATSATASTVAGTTPGVEVLLSSRLEWLTPPVDQDVTISGTITANIWAAESSMNANVAINFRVDKVAATDGTLTTIVTSARTTEVAVTTQAVNNFTATPTSTALNKGDRLRIVIFGDDAGTMGSGFTFSVGYNEGTAASAGDTYISFTETFGFQTTDPTGTTIYLTDDASAVATADTDLEAWTARGNTATGLQNLHQPASGWIAPDQYANTNITWFSRALQAFTLSGLVKANVWASEGAATQNMSFGVEIARVDNDGTNATVWGYANRDAATTSGGAGELATTSTAYTVYIAGDDLAFTDGQRIRVRCFADDCADIPIVGTALLAIRYDGDTGGANGDTFLIFGQTLTESVPGKSPPPPRKVRTYEAARDFDPDSVTGWL